MNLARSLARELKTRWLQRFASRPVRIRLEAPLVSLSFDDVPISAIENGLPLLVKHGVKATFYVSLGIQPSGAFISRDAIREVARDGHEIGCHTYTHYQLSRGSSAGLLADAARSRIALADAMDGRPPRSFSFPFGELSFASKRGLAAHYDSLRSSRDGVNSGLADLNCLRANSLGCASFARDRIDALLDHTSRSGGWLILYTHGICDTPGRWDLTPGMLAGLLSAVADRGLRFVTVAEAVRRVSAVAA
jgi:peptidoglycan/xylan/chitin deacetylase (PgdA/CDA1 family)